MDKNRIWRRIQFGIRVFLLEKTVLTDIGIINVGVQSEMELVFKQASLSEIEIAFGLLREAALWMKEHGIDYWKDWINPSENFKNWIRSGFKNKEFYFVENNGKIIAMFRLQYEDGLFWGEKKDRSGYIHSFTTKRNLSGKGLGKKILREIEKKLKLDSYDYLRLGCGSHVEGLCRYYEKYGFEKVEETSVYGEKLTLYEKKLQ